MSIKFNKSYASEFIRENDLIGLETQVAAAHKMINDKSGLGNDFLGWVSLPVDYDKEEFARIQKAAEKIQNDSEVLLVIGIGGSYLGARAVIEALTGSFDNYSRDDIVRMIEKNSGKASTSVSKKTSFLIAGDAAGSKLTKARDPGIEVLSIDEFINRIK